MSVILRPPAHAMPLVTIAAGLAIVEGIDAATGFSGSVKWPNDVFAGRRKLAGILAEAGSSLNRGRHVVLGVGINVGAASHPHHVARTATSLEEELGRPVDRGLVFAECLAALASRYADLTERRGHDVLAAWRRRAVDTFGRRVEWDGAGATITGTIEDIDEDGGLLVRTGTGVSRVIAGEIRWA
jgi:BirA family transcriptional regulator, biotin operon repressor / biotin---[acetyl-CoA-carboxylase] ligase